MVAVEVAGQQRRLRFSAASCLMQELVPVPGHNRNYRDSEWKLLVMNVTIALTFGQGSAQLRKKARIRTIDWHWCGVEVSGCGHF